MRKLLLFLFLISATVLLGQATNLNSLTLRYRLCTDCNETGNTGEQSLQYNILRTYEQRDSGIAVIRNFTNRDVTSDYGPRTVSGSTWHKGVDFRAYRHSLSGGDFGGSGTALYSPYDVPARINHIMAEGTYKTLGLKRSGGPNVGPTFSYAHLFHKQVGVPPEGLRTGNFVLKRMDGDLSDWFAIIDLERQVAIAPVIGTVSITISGNTVSYTTTSVIAPNQPIGPMGRSGPSEYATHLHLDLFSSPPPNHSQEVMVSSNLRRDNRLDPLSLLVYDMPEYEVSLKTLTSTSDGAPITFTANNITYPGNLSTKLMVRAKMMDAERPIPPVQGTDEPGSRILADSGYFRYSNVVYNVDDVEILLKGKADTAFATIRGPRVESRFSHGGRPTSSLYPFDTSATAVSPYDLNGVNVTSTVRLYQSTTVWNRYGIRPHAYRDFSGFPYDEYFYPAFITRIHREAPLASNDSLEIAHRPSDARYNDGPYQMMAKVTTVRDSIFTSDTLDFVLDNFNTYV